MNYQRPGFNSLVSRRPYYILSLLKVHKKIIYSDIDTVWLSDPRPYFKGDLDFWSQIDGVIDGQPYFKGFIPYVCTGFLALRSTEKTIKMLNQWHIVTSRNETVHQGQNVLQNIVFQLSVNFGVLPVRHFPFGKAYFEAMTEMERSEVVIVHNNFITGRDRKINRFKNFHLWALDFSKDKMCMKEISKNVLQRSVFQCYPNDATSAENGFFVYPGTVLLSEESLRKAYLNGRNDFKTELNVYFYEAS